jgi:hypothetical protein
VSDDDKHPQQIKSPQNISTSDVVYEDANLASGLISVFIMLCVFFWTGMVFIEMQQPAKDAGSGIAQGMALLFMWGPIIVGLIPAWILLRFSYFRRFGKWTVMLCSCILSLIGIVGYFFVA